MAERKIQEIESKIFDQKRQLLVKIPADVRERLEIDPAKDIFVWVIIEDENGISLKGVLKKNERKE